MIIITDEIWETLDDVQSYWNDKIQYTRDIEQYRLSDYWTVPEEIKGKCEGDCEDYACAKQKDLDDTHSIDSYLTTCWTETGGYHAVLIVHTDRGDMVLDNRYPFVKQHSDLPYKWHKMEGEDGKWYAIS